jgi:hypothetical protein
MFSHILAILFIGSLSITNLQLRAQQTVAIVYNSTIQVHQQLYNNLFGSDFNQYNWILGNANNNPVPLAFRQNNSTSIPYKLIAVDSTAEKE